MANELRSLGSSTPYPDIGVIDTPVTPRASTPRQAGSPPRLGSLVHSPSRVLVDELQENLSNPLKMSTKTFEDTLSKNPELTDPKRKNVLLTLLKGKADCMLKFVNEYMEKSKELHELQIPSKTPAQVDEKESASDSRRMDASKSKKFTSSDLVHELRSPLNNIIGCLSGLRQAEDPTVLLGHLRISYAHLNTLVKNIKVQDAPLKLKPETFSMPDLIARVDGLTQQLKPGISISFHLNLSNAKQGFKGDITKLSQVLVNLISNAVKFSPVPGEVHVNIEALKEESTGTVFRFSIQDGGPGISVDKQKQLFKRFSQLDQPKGDQTASSGVGLSVSFDFVQLMGGTEGIKIDSNPESGQKGARFYFDLPIDKSSSVRVSSPQSKISDNLSPGYDILIADDSSITRSIFGMLYQKYTGQDIFTAHIVNDGPSAVDAFKDHYYHIVVLDNMMPNQDDGWNAARKIFEMAREKRLAFPQVIICSGLDVEEQKLKAAQSDNPIDQALSRVGFFHKNGPTKHLVERTFQIGKALMPSLQ